MHLPSPGFLVRRAGVAPPPPLGSCVWRCVWGMGEWLTATFKQAPTHKSWAHGPKRMRGHVTGILLFAVQREGQAAVAGRGRACPVHPLPAGDSSSNPPSQSRKSVRVGARVRRHVDPRQANLRSKTGSGRGIGPCAFHGPSRCPLPRGGGARPPMTCVSRSHVHVRLFRPIALQCLSLRLPVRLLPSGPVGRGP